MKIVFMGTPDFAVPVLKALVKAGHTVPLVITQPDKPRGRSGKLSPTPVKEAAGELGIEVYAPERLRKSDAAQMLRELHPDLIVVSAYGQIIPPEILKIPKYCCVNTHASLLPKYRGAAPIQHAILDGEAVTGVTIMRMDEGLDTGDIIARSEVQILPEETGGSLFDKLSDEAARLLIQTIPDIADGTAEYEKQPGESPTPYASMISREMGRLDFSRPAEELERRIRALDPQPGAYTGLDGKTFKIWKAVTRPGDSGAAPGTVLSADKTGICIACGSGSLAVMEVQLQGKKRMSADAFLRGYPLMAGEMLSL